MCDGRSVGGLVGSRLWGWWDCESDSWLQFSFKWRFWFFLSKVPLKGFYSAKRQALSPKHRFKLDQEDQKAPQNFEIQFFPAPHSSATSSTQLQTNLIFSFFMFEWQICISLFCLLSFNFLIWWHSNYTYWLTN